MPGRDRRWRGPQRPETPVGRKRGWVKVAGFGNAGQWRRPMRQERTAGNAESLACAAALPTLRVCPLERFVDLALRGCWVMVARWRWRGESAMQGRAGGFSRPENRGEGEGF